MQAPNLTPLALRQWRARAHLTQTQAGEILGLSLRQYQRLEDGKSKISRTLELLHNRIVNDENTNA